MSKLNEYAIVYVDDEVLSLKYFEKGFSEDFHILTASNAADAWEIIASRSDTIGLLMSDQRMPGQTGVQLLEKVRLNFPHIIRILVTAYSDVESAVAGINASAIYKYVSKPWDVTELRLTLLRALEFCGVLRERDNLLREKLSVIQQIVLSDRAKNLGVLAAGLGCGFRNTLIAANRFVAALPENSPGEDRLELLHSGIGNRIETLIGSASDAIFQVASELRVLAAQPNAFETEPTPLHVMLRPLLKESASLPGLESLLSQISGIPPIKANKIQIVKLFGNLLRGIRSIGSETTTTRLQARELKREDGALSVELTIADDGSPWTQEQHRRFFSPFSELARAHGDSGLHLAVCFFIAHHHGGSIDVIGKPEMRIRLELPIDPDLVKSPVAESRQLSQLFQHERFLEQFLMGNQ
ncbi:MAG: response regulator [Verrucomicrobia bacterium]|nr:response regulator [Verrucomicrobiota bacterium]